METHDTLHQQYKGFIKEELPNTNRMKLTEVLNGIRLSEDEYYTNMVERLGDAYEVVSQSTLKKEEDKIYDIIKSMIGNPYETMIVGGEAEGFFEYDVDDMIDTLFKHKKCFVINAIKSNRNGFAGDIVYIDIDQSEIDKRFSITINLNGCTQIIVWTDPDPLQTK